MLHRFWLAAISLFTVAATVSWSSEPVDDVAEPLPPRALARLGSYRFYHGPDVNSAVLSPDGRMIASASLKVVSKNGNPQYVNEKGIILWDKVTGQRIRELQVPNAPVFDLEFSPNSKQLAARFGDHPEPSGIALFDVDSGKLLKQITGPDFRLRRFSPDGKSLYLSEGYRNNVILWDIEAGKRTRTWTKPDKLPKWLKGDEFVCQVHVTPDGKYLAWLVDVPPDSSKRPPGASSDGYIPLPKVLILVDADTEKPVYRKEFLPDHLHWFAISANGRRFLAGKDKFSVYEMATGTKLFDLDVPSSHPLVLSPDGRFAVEENGSSQVRLWNLQTKKPSHELLKGRIPVRSSLDFSPDGKSVLLVTRSTLRLFDTATGKECLSPGHRSPIMPWFSDDGRTLVTTCVELRRTWDVSSAMRPLLVRDQPRNTWEGICGKPVLTHSQDGRYFVSGRRKSTPEVCDTATGKGVRELESNPLPASGLFSRDATRLLFWNLASNDSVDSFRLYDPRTGKEMGAITTSNRVGDPAMSSDGRLVAWPDGDQAVHLHDGTTGKLVRTLRSIQNLPREERGDAVMLFSPDGSRLIVTTYQQERVLKPDGDKWVTFPTRVFRVSDGKEISRFYTNPQTTNRALRHSCTACSPDGRLLAVAEYESGTIRLIEIASGTVRTLLTGHRHGVHGLAFSPDGRTLASGGEDAVTILWDVFDTRTGAARKEASENELARAWTDLASNDGKQIDAAFACFLRTPCESVRFLKKRLRPSEPIDDKRLAQLIADLDADVFARREAASSSLTQLGERAEAALRKALKTDPPAETQRRIERLLENLDHRLLPPETLRELRAVEILERLGTPDARQLVRALLEGAQGAALTEDARESWRRLAKRSVQP